LSSQRNSSLHAGWRTHSGGHAVIYIFERISESNTRFTVCNSGQGLNYHPKSEKDFPETKHLTSLSIDQVPWSRITDEGFLFTLINLYTSADNNDPHEVFYFDLLPHLAGVPLAEAVARTEQVTDWDTSQRAGTCFYRCCLVALRYCLRRQAFALQDVKTVKLALRVEQLHVAASDLARGGDVEAEDRSAYEVWKKEVISGFNDLERSSHSRASRMDDTLRRLGVLPEDGTSAGNQSASEAAQGATESAEVGDKLVFDMTPSQRQAVCLKPFLAIEASFPSTVGSITLPKNNLDAAKTVQLPASQAHMIHLALRQTAHAALKAHKRGTLCTAGLQEINKLLMWLDSHMRSDFVELTGASAQLPPQLKLDTISTTFRPIVGVEMLADSRDTSSFAGASR
jgi:hypothetical protein